MPMTPVSQTPGSNVKTLRQEAADCRACPLWKNATQTVFGEGPATGIPAAGREQPGDKEDLAGRPAGQMLDRALEQAGIDRKKVYVTNAVKHFKFVPRGKVRLHQKPNTSEIRACRQWYERELGSVRPDLPKRGNISASDDLGIAADLIRKTGFVEKGLVRDLDGTSISPTRGVAMHNHSRRYSSQGFDISLHNL